MRRNGIAFIKALILLAIILTQGVYGQRQKRSKPSAPQPEPRPQAANSGTSFNREGRICKAIGDNMDEEMTAAFLLKDGGGISLLNQSVMDSLLPLARTSLKDGFLPVSTPKNRTIEK